MVFNFETAEGRQIASRPSNRNGRASPLTDSPFPTWNMFKNQSNTKLSLSNATTVFYISLALHITKYEACKGLFKGTKWGSKKCTPLISDNRSWVLRLPK